MKTFLMTGGTGFLGMLLSAKLIEEGHKLIFLGRTKDGIHIKDRIKDSLWNFDKTLNFELVEIYETNFSKNNLGLSEDEIEYLKNKKIDGFWHLAANLSFKEQNRNDVFSTNLYSLTNILNFTQKINTPIFYTSTAYIHGTNQGVLPEENAPRPKKFNNPYEESKFEAEKVIREWSLKNEKNKYIIFRPSLIIEKKKHTFSLFGYYSFIVSLYKLRKNIIIAQKKHPVILRLLGVKYKNGILFIKFPFLFPKTGHLNLIPVDIVVDWMMDIVGKIDSLNKTYHIVNTYPTEISNITRQMFKAIGIQMTTLEVSNFTFGMYIKLVYLASLLIRTFRGFSKKLQYYQFYMTENRIYEVKNTERLGIKISKKKFGIDNIDYIEKMTKDFICKFMN